MTLGGIAPSVDSRAQVNVKRHPTLQSGVILGSGAQVLGPITIGEGARVGANSVVTRDVPPGLTAVGIPAHVMMPRDRAGRRASLRMERLPGVRIRSSTASTHCAGRSAS